MIGPNPLFSMRFSGQYSHPQVRYAQGRKENHTCRSPWPACAWLTIAELWFEVIRVWFRPLWLYKVPARSCDDPLQRVARRKLGRPPFPIFLPFPNGNSCDIFEQTQGLAEGAGMLKLTWTLLPHPNPSPPAWQKCIVYCWFLHMCMVLGT